MQMFPLSDNESSFMHDFKVEESRPLTQSSRAER